MVNITIDNHTIAVPSGTTIMEAAASIHIPIPKLCYLKDINEIGACRVCVVEIEGQDHLVTSCNNVVEEGMTIYTNSPKVRRNRKHTVEMILSQHDAQCATCVRSGNCTLQTVANDLNIVDSLIRRKSVSKNGIQDIHWYVMQANVSNVCVVYKYATRFRECISGMYLELEQEQQLEFQKTEISKQQIVHYVDSVSHIVQQEHYVNEMIQTNYIVH